MRDMASRYWRPFGYWALTLNVSFGFPAILIAHIVRPEGAWGTVAGSFSALLMAWCAAAGIRQWGKNDGAELDGPP